VRDVQCFLGFANFYRRFIKNYSQIVAPLTNLTRKTPAPHGGNGGGTFHWSPEAQAAFEKLKSAFTSAPILAHADPSQPYIVETDASDFALGAVLSQRQEHDGQVHPVAFYSRKFTSAEINYDVYDKELLAIISAFEQWRNYLSGAQHTITVFCDHRNLVYFSSTRVLNRRQARWSLFLADFDFVITYRAGAYQGKPDALSRRREYQSKKGEEAFDQQETILLKPHQLRLNALLPTPKDTTLTDQIREALLKDPFAHNIQEGLLSPHTRDNHHKYFSFNEETKLLYRNGLLYVPDLPSRLKILHSCHDAAPAGHFGITKTKDLITRHYWWPRLRHVVTEYIKSCDTCARAKTPRHRPHGLLHPLPVPSRPWQSISMDFVTDLPLSKKDHRSSTMNAILVVVDRLTKMAHFLPCQKTINAEETATLLLHEVFKLHGLPEDITSDRGPQFASKFWARLFELLGAKINLSSAYHPQTDGQSERVNQVLEQYLRCFIDHQQSNWSELLPLAELAYNNSRHASTRQTPFFANYGYHPRFEIQSPTTPMVPSAESRVAQIQKIHHHLVTELTKAQQRAISNHPRSKPGSVSPGSPIVAQNS
jgi:transposase InsO family protein